MAGKPKSNCQSPSDERVLEESDGEIRYALVFHYLDFNKPLRTPAAARRATPLRGPADADPRHG